MQIRKVTDYSKPAAVKHKNGQTTMLHPDHAKKINNALSAMKPNDREKVVNHMHAHPNNLKQVIQHVSK
jgi:predicted LPLAT superfamily acyltransferase